MMPTASTNAPVRRFRLLQGLLPFNRAQLPHDIVAGITLAALGIPEVMGYTKISGTPTVTGLYTILLPLVAFALLGASRHLVVWLIRLRQQSSPVPLSQWLPWGARSTSGLRAPLHWQWPSCSCLRAFFVLAFLPISCRAVH